MAGDPLRRVFLSGDGSTGIEVALKLALQFQRQAGDPRRTRFASLANGYHGESIATMSVSDCDLYKGPFAPLCFPSIRLGPVPERSGPDDPAWQDAAAEWPAIEAQLAAVADELAAILVEPLLQGAGGMRVYSPDLLRRLRRWCDDHGVLLMADEIATGMGRLGTYLACHQAGILPDIAVLSKGLTGGYLPLAATVTSERIYQAFLGDWGDGRAFLHSNTYSGNALACAVAREVFATYRADGILQRVQGLAPHLAQGIRATADRSRHLTRPRAVGMVAAVDLIQANGQPFPGGDRTGYRIYQEAVRRGVLLRNLGDTLYLFPPLIADHTIIDQCLTVMNEATVAVLGR